MTTEAQANANWVNAKKSTGPKSKSGKAKVARNATRHGATRAPDPEQVMDWFRVIRETPELGAADILKDDDTTRMALRLAGAEVQLISAQAALVEFEASPDVLSRDPDLQNIVQNVGEHMAFEAGARTEDEIVHYCAKARQEFLEKFNLRRVCSSEMRLLRRYLREARGQRDRAFKAWVAHLSQTRVRHGETEHTRHTS